jgi:CRP-like cAMP-binding protein
LAGAQLFRGLRPDDLEPLLDAFQTRDFPSGMKVLCPGETGLPELFVVLDGRLAVTRLSMGDHRRAEYVGPGDIFGELSVLGPGPRTWTAMTLTPVRLATLDQENYVSWVFVRPHAAERVLRALAQRLEGREDEALELVFIDVGARLAKALTNLAGRFGKRTSTGVVVEHGLNQTQLAEIVGTTRETLNKRLSEFVQEGWLISERGRFVIRDSEGLEFRASALPG